MREWIGGPPKKKELRDKVDQIGEKPCICELIDNCIDYWTFTGRREPLRIEIRLRRDRTAEKSINPICGISMKWNMAIPRNKMDSLVTLGSKEDEGEGIIGLWGQGAKISMHGIARAWTVTTCCEGKKRKITCSEDWIQNENEWRLPLDTSECESESPEETIFESQTLHEDKWKEVKQDEQYHESGPIDLESGLRTHLSLKYSQFSRMNPQLSISVNSEPVELIDVLSHEVLRRDYLWIPGFEPHYNIFEILASTSSEEPRSLKIKIFVGLHVRGLKEEAGVYLYGNNRLFLSAFKRSPLYKGYQPKDTRMRVHVFLEGYSRDIMWGWPEKDGLNEDHREIDRLAELIKISVEPYGQIVTLTTEHLDLYSLEGNTSSLLEKAGLDGAQAAATAVVLDQVREQNSKRLRLFMTTEGRGTDELKGLDKKFKKVVARWITDTKEGTMSHVGFHLALGEAAIKDKEMKNEIRRARRLVPKEAGQITDYVANEAYESRKASEKSKRKPEKNIGQRTLDSFYPALDRIGEIMGEEDRNKVLKKVQKALDKMAKKLEEKGYDDKEKKIYKGLLGIK